MEHHSYLPWEDVYFIKDGSGDPINHLAVDLRGDRDGCIIQRKVEAIVQEREDISAEPA